MDNYLRGAMPSADRAMALAEVLEVGLPWLIWGEGDPKPRGDSDSAGEMVELPRYDLRDFGEYKPAPVEQVRIRADLLGRWASSRGLWLAELPFDTEVAQEGEVVLCRDPEAQLADGRVYALLLDGRLTVRRVQMRPDGLVLRSAPSDPDPITLTPEQLDQFQPIARILAAVSPQPV